MKKILALLLIVLPFCIVACSKDAAENGSSNKNAEYYVKYASDGLGVPYYNVSYTDDTGKKQSFYNLNSDSFERTIGPVSVGFEASFRIWVDNGNDSRTRAARIELKKDNNPFVVKVEKTGFGAGGVSVTYTIE